MSICKPDPISIYKIYSEVAPYCVKYYEKAEDHGAARLKDKILIMENKGMICLNPDNPNLGVHVYYSDRYELNSKMDSLQIAGEEVIDSLKLIRAKN